VHGNMQVFFHSLFFVLYSSHFLLERGECQSVSLELETEGEDLEICHLHVRAHACKKSIRIGIGIGARTHTLNRVNCFLNNPTVMLRDEISHPQSEDICKYLIEDCPAPRNPTECPPAFYYGYLKEYCKVIQKDAIMLSSRDDQHESTRQEITLSTTKACAGEIKSCILEKEKIPLSMKVQNGLRNALFKDPLKTCPEWHLGKYIFKDEQCSSRAKINLVTPYDQSEPIANQPPNQANECQSKKHANLNKKTKNFA